MRYGGYDGCFGGYGQFIDTLNATNLTSSNVSFTGGNADGMTIGGTTPAAGTFTSLISTGGSLRLANSNGDIVLSATTLFTSSATTFQVAGNFATTAPNTQTGASYTVAATDNSLIINASGTCTLTLPAASSYTGRVLIVKTIAAQSVISAASNVVPLASATPGTAILAATAGKFAYLVSNGTNWVTMMAN